MRYTPRALSRHLWSRPSYFVLSCAFFILSCLVLASCTNGRPIQQLPLALPEPTPSYPPVRLPADDAPHDYLTEWWYYTGHLQADTGERYGFEYVTFQAVRGQLPTAYVGHFAITDQQRESFQYDHRLITGDRMQQTDGFDLPVDGWRMRGSNGLDMLQAAMSDYRIDLNLQSRKPAVLHETDGLISFGAAGDSYYYTRTRIDVNGILDDHGQRKNVTGTAWFDHQWGNFLVLGGGWDWFSAQLDDGTDLMLNLIRDEDGVLQLAYGTLVEPNGDSQHLPAEAFSIEPTDSWVSPTTGARYPSGWDVTVRGHDLRLHFEPVMKNQELVTVDTTGQTYWEGENRVSGTRDGKTLGGWGYVELTGYANAQ